MSGASHRSTYLLRTDLFAAESGRPRPKRVPGGDRSWQLDLVLHQCVYPCLCCARARGQCPSRPVGYVYLEFAGFLLPSPDVMMCCFAPFYSSFFVSYPTFAPNLPHLHPAVTPPLPQVTPPLPQSNPTPSQCYPNIRVHFHPCRCPCGISLGSNF